LYLRLCDGFDWKRQIKRLNINILGSLFIGRTGSRGLIVFRLRSDHAFSKLCAQTAPVTRFCGFLVQLVLSKKEKIRLT